MVENTVVCERGTTWFQLKLWPQLLACKVFLVYFTLLLLKRAVAQMG